MVVSEVRKSPFRMGWTGYRRYIFVVPEVGLTIQNGKNRVSVAPKPGIGHHILPFLVSERAPPSPQNHHPIRVKPGITHTDYSSEKKSFTISQKNMFYTPTCT